MTAETGAWTLYGEPGWGSAIAELQLAWYKETVVFRSVGNLFSDPAAVEALRQVNPLAQIPTLVPPDGSVLTESGAITLVLADRHPGPRCLVPVAGTPERAPFLRWLLFVNAAIYPCYTFYDRRETLVPDPVARIPFSTAMEERLQQVYRQWNAAIAQTGGPWVLGDRLSALDFYAGVMTRWEPRPAWFAAETPALWAAAERARALPDLAATWARNTVSDSAS